MTLKTVICCLSILSISLAQEKCASENEFLCKTGGCISKQFLCDGSKECFDGSDETRDLCQNRSCSQSSDYVDTDIDDIFAIPPLGVGQSFKCNYGACISSHFVCDGIKNCVGDGSDETEELCRQHKCEKDQFRCDYGGCISRQSACDNRYHCFDRSDETSKTCDWRRKSCRSRDQFRCSYGACIRKKQKCNAVFDCLVDGSDESEETCGHRPNIHIVNTSFPISSRIRTTEPPPTIRPIGGFP